MLTFRLSSIARRQLLKFSLLSPHLRILIGIFIVAQFFETLKVFPDGRYHVDRLMGHVAQTFGQNFNFLIYP